MHELQRKYFLYAGLGRGDTASTHALPLWLLGDDGLAGGELVSRLGLQGT